MKIVAVICMFLFSISGQAVSVLWNEGVSLHEGSSANWWITLSLREAPYYLEVHNDASFLVEETEREWIRSLRGNMIDLASGAIFITAEVGDLVSSQTVRDESKILVTNYGYNPDQGARVTYNANQKQTLYIGFEATILFTGNHPFDPVTGTIVDDDKRIYGWIELFADDMTLTLGNTCLDLSGRPVVVGVRSAEPVPEPATGALALLGAALLFRRRKT